MLSIVIVDSIKSNARQLENIIKNNVDTVKMKHVTNESDLFDFLKSVSGTVNIAFVDVGVVSDNENGIGIAKRLNREYPEIKVVFTSNNIYDHIEDIFAVNVFGCLVKPYVGEKASDKTAETVRRIFAKLDEMNESSAKDYVAVEVRGRTVKVALSSIISVESDKRKINIIMNNGTSIDMYMKLDEFCKKLPSNSFIRCHKSYCVNANYVTAMSNDAFLLSNGESVPISRASQPVVKKEYVAFLGDKLY